MKTLEYKVMFMTPAFLGNAEQVGQWRTPPFKALLRQWWRIAYAADHGFDLNTAAMRREEGLLFGNAWLDHQEQGRTVADHCKSLVRLRLSAWGIGRQKSWDRLASLSHPEVNRPVDAGLYLGYGPITLPSGERVPALKRNAAIQAGESAALRIAFPTTASDANRRRLCEANAPRIERAFTLMDRFGTIGGRSRNGWGSCRFQRVESGGGGVAESGPSGTLPLRPWAECLTADWPHAIGCDERGPLIWETEPFPDWKAVMNRLAEIKIGLRTHFPFTTGRNAPRPDARHWLCYPVTNHSVRDWRNERLPNSLRFKARPDPNGELRGLIFHVPCLPPAQFRPDRTAIVALWQQVYGLLDDPTHGLTRIPT